MAELNDIEFYKGEAVSLYFTMTPSVGSILGWSIMMTILDNFGDTVPLLSIAGVVTDAAGGVFLCSLTHAQVVALGVGTFAYDVQRTDGGSEAVLSIGTLVVKIEGLYP